MTFGLPYAKQVLVEIGGGPATLGAQCPICDLISVPVGDVISDVAKAASRAYADHYQEAHA